MQGQLQGKHVPDVVLDTGCSQTMVWQNLVPAGKKVIGEAVTVRCAHSDTVLHPLAEEMELEGMKLKVKAAISESLPVSVRLGTELGQLLQQKDIEPTLSGEAMVVTRARAQKEEVSHTAKERESGV